MSNIDELLKLKELLDKEIITKEEFEKEKSKLLNSNTQTDIGKIQEKNINISQKKKTSPKGCLIVFVIFLFFICIGTIAGLKSTPNGRNEAKTLLIGQYNLSEEEAENVLNTINQCGYSDYYSNYSLAKGIDNEEIAGSIGFEITIGEKIVGFVDIKDNAVCLVQYSDKVLYKDHIIQHTLSEYVITENEKIDFIRQTQNGIAAILKSPSTAKFPWNYDEWNVWKQDGVTIVQGYVDSQNGFGATVRSTFQVKYKNDTVTSLIFDGTEYMK